MPRLAQFAATEIFIDANIFLYVINDNPRFGEPCHELVAKIERGEVEGYTSHFVVSEIVHKMMQHETCQRFDLPLAQAVSFLKRNPRVISTLRIYRDALNLIFNVPNLILLEIDNAILRQSHSMIRDYQLLSTDALHAATCLAYNIRHFATNDKDFTRVQELTIWSPQ